MHLVTLGVVLTGMMASVALSAPLRNKDSREPIAKADNSLKEKFAVTDDKKDFVEKDSTVHLDGLYMMDFKSEDDEPNVVQRQSGRDIEKRDSTTKLDGLYMMFFKVVDEEPEPIVTR
jgi:hypothetical protein